MIRKTNGGETGEDATVEDKKRKKQAKRQQNLSTLCNQYSTLRLRCQAKSDMQAILSEGLVEPETKKTLCKQLFLQRVLNGRGERI